MARKCKCAICGNSFEPNDYTFKVGKKNICSQPCMIEYEERSREEEYRRTIIQILLEINDSDYVNPVWLRLIKSYHDESGYTYKGMVTVLNYMRDILQLDNKSEMHYINSIPYHYSECKRYYVDQIERRKKTRNFIDNKKEFTTIEKIIVPRYTVKDMKNDLKYIDMSIFEGEDDEE